MATVTQILDRAARITGLRMTAGTTERALALAALNDVYARAVSEAETHLDYASYTIPTSEDVYYLADICSEEPQKLVDVSLNDQLGLGPLQQVSFPELREEHESHLSAGSPYMYAVVGFDRIAFEPNVSVGDTVNVWYVPPVPELVEDGPAANQQSTPSWVPNAFHWDVLLPGIVIQMLDKDQRIAEGGTWNTRYENGLARLKEYMGQVGGTANRAYLPKPMGRYSRPDERRRF